MPPEVTHRAADCFGTDTARHRTIPGLAVKSGSRPRLRTLSYSSVVIVPLLCKNPRLKACIRKMIVRPRMNSKETTMRHTMTAIVLAALLTLPAAAEAATDYGQPITVQETTRVSDILDNPDQYIGKDVRVEGMIVEVCARRGCWMEIAGDRQYEKMKIKVEDGVIVFPLSARGKKALVQGKVEAVSMGIGEAKRYFAHQAREKGTTFDPSTVTGPVSFYQIRATGAVID
jgi:hypothetical protein